MKIRKGHVSNSSSSSFIIDKYKISGYQIDLLLNPEDLFKDFLKQKYEEICGWDDDITLNEYMMDKLNEFDVDSEDGYDGPKSWTVCDGDRYIRFSCIMDNFQYDEYAEFIGVPRGAIKYEN